MATAPLLFFCTLMMVSSGPRGTMAMAPMVLGGTEAQVGYDAGDYFNYYTVPGSMTPSIVDIETTSNVGIPGMYIFKVDSPTPGKSRCMSKMHVLVFTHIVHYPNYKNSQCLTNLCAKRLLRIAHKFVLTTLNGVNN